MEHPFFAGSGKLHASDAVAAILVLEDGRYVMQLRDPKPEIFYPDHWGCFGGAVEPGEQPLGALQRELLEEIEFDVGDAHRFTQFDFDLTPLGQDKVFRIYYEIAVSADALSRMVLHEGAELRAFSGKDILSQPRVKPYDAFALFLHWKRERFS